MNVRMRPERAFSLRHSHVRVGAVTYPTVAKTIVNSLIEWLAGEFDFLGHDLLLSPANVGAIVPKTGKDIAALRFGTSGHWAGLALRA